MSISTSSCMEPAFRHYGLCGHVSLILSWPIAVSCQRYWNTQHSTMRSRANFELVHCIMKTNGNVLSKLVSPTFGIPFIHQQVIAKPWAPFTVSLQLGTNPTSLIIVIKSTSKY